MTDKTYILHVKIDGEDNTIIAPSFDDDISGFNLLYFR